MKYRQLGNSSLQVSEISLGGMSLGDNYHEAEKIIHKALDVGINFFDTADLYQKGENERILGKALGSKRDEVIIATKVGNQWKPDGSGWKWNPSPDYIISAVEDSLRRLQIDVIDIYQLHGGTIDDPIDDIISAFETLVTQGKIRYYGISSIRPNVIRAYLDKSQIASVMSQYSLLDRRPEEETLRLMKDHKIGVLVRGAIAKGLLSGKVARAFLDYSAEEVVKIQHILQTLSGTGITPGQAAIQYVLAHPAVTTIVTGASSVQQIEENALAAEARKLNEDELELLKQATKASKYEKHRN